MRLEDFVVYNMAMDLGEEVYAIVEGWDYFQRDTIGKQLVRACDSIAANLSEGLGRYHYKERKNFSYYSRGSLYETNTWLTKAKNRNQVKQEKYDELIKSINVISIKLNNYIKTIGPSTS